MVALCKELTKLHEDVKIGYLDKMIPKEDIPLKGEYIILIANKKYRIDE